MCEFGITEFNNGSTGVPFVVRTSENPCIDFRTDKPVSHIPLLRITCLFSDQSLLSLFLLCSSSSEIFSFYSRITNVIY